MPAPVKLYGIPRSRAFRCLVAAEEARVYILGHSDGGQRPGS